MRTRTRPPIGRATLAFAVALVTVVLPSAPSHAAVPSIYQLTSIELGDPLAGPLAINEVTNTIYATNYTPTSSFLVVLDADTAAVTSVVPLPRNSGAVAVNEANNRIYVTNNGANTITVIDGFTATVTSTIPVSYGPAAIAVDESSDTIYVANSATDTLSVIDGATDTVTGTIVVGSAPSAMAFNAATSTLYVTNSSSNTVSVIDTATETVTATIPVGDNPDHIAVDEANNTVYLSDVYGFSVLMIDGATNTIAATIPTGQGSYPSGVAVDVTTGSVYVVNTNYGQMLRIDTASNTVTGTKATGTRNEAMIAVNTTTQRIYIPRGSGESSIAVIAPMVETRLAGNDRFATSAAISAATFAAGTPVVYIANGLGFPDALSGAAAAATNGGPVLLVLPTTIPAPIQAELTRLNPGRIVVLGGTGVVSDTVMTALTAYTSGGVTRLAGSDRFATSAAISAATFAPGLDVVYIANGLDFPDALSGAAAAGANGGPVLLVLPTAIPAPIRTELTRLNPARIVVLGGTGVVSDAVKSALSTSTSGTVTRLAGNDRFATSAAISAATFAPDAPVVYIANGLDFPDALSGAAAAGTNGSPVLLVTPYGMTIEFVNELKRLNPRSIAFLGGEGAVSALLVEGVNSHF